MNNINNRTSSKEAADFSLKQENHHDKTKKASTSSTTTTTTSSLTASSSQWLRSKDPRIVRVSRAFGGKDRHSKVCTVKGLRDRRVRLSVSTAIQLYDLQDRLGFSQPSKVVDWLLDAAKHEIDELPPLQIPPGSFSNFCHQPVTSMNNQVISSTSQQNEQGFNIMEGSNSVMSKSKGEVAIDEEKANWNRREEEEDRNNHHHHYHPSFLDLMNTVPPLGYNVNNNPWGANSNLGFANQQTDLHSNSTNVVPFSGLSSNLSLSTGTIAQTYFPSHYGAIMDMEPSKQMNQYQMLMSSSNSLMNPSVVNNTTSQQQPTKPFSFAMMMTPKLLRSPNSSETQPRNKDQVFPSK
ncbi:hypothetical protein K1719_031942 [Acacia pycnantha]|nr:hypothetical protein K1719_031942 [Acacia pycnantha]